EAMGVRGREMGWKEGLARPQDREQGKVWLRGVISEPLQKLVVEQRVENDTRRLLDLRQYAIELLLGPYQGINVLDRRDLGVLRGCGTRNGGQGFTGRIGYEVKVEIAASTLCHDNNGTNCELLGRRPRAHAERKSTID